ncbi:MAG TPA: serine/threonine-protein kinase [Thermoanaerobaculia bacterium]|nr:serine/threonine-protein kinase [Thermoanaerobaculia bacterium]
MSSPDLPSSIGPYRVTELLGRAGQTIVYKAVKPAQSRPVAVKLFPAALSHEPAAAERFHKDLRAVAPVSRHPNLVQIHETGQDGDRLFLAMELVDGRSLDRVLRERRLTVPEAITVLRGVCRGLAQAHEHGFLHRRLTPRNILISDDFDTVKLSDVGASGFEVATNLTGTVSTGEINLGALYYLAPEQVEGGQAGDHRADLYSAGVIFHEMLTGRKPGPKFALPSQLNPQLPPETDVVVLKCLARRPGERYATALDLLEELEKLEERLRLRVVSEIRDISQAGSRLLGAEGGGEKRPVLLWVGIAVAVLAALALAGFLLL